MKQYIVVYQFNHSKMGFNNSITVIAANTIEAKQKAMNEVSMCYGANMFKKFTFKEPMLK